MSLEPVYTFWFPTVICLCPTLTVVTPSGITDLNVTTDHLAWLGGWFVQTLKRGLWFMELEKGNQKKKLANLFTHRSAPNSSYGEAPSVVVFGWNISSPLDLLKSDLWGLIYKLQVKQAVTGQHSIICNCTLASKFMQHMATETKSRSSSMTIERVLYTVKMEDHQVWKSHIGQLLWQPLPIFSSL